MRVVISAGGTGGHIYPAIAIINKIKEHEPNSDFLYIGTTNRMEKDIIPQMGIKYVGIEMGGLKRKLTWDNFKILKKFFDARKKCLQIIKEFDPDIVIGVGGYVTAPVIWAGHKLGKKTFIHEQNSVVGLSNRYLSGIVDKVGVSFESTIKCFPKNKAILTGNPCSEKALNMKKADKKDYGLSNDKKLVLIVMGSLGSTSINNKILSFINDFKDKDYEVMFVTGKDNYDRMSKCVVANNIKIVPYINDMPSLMKTTDLMITRAGASTISEITALGVPSIFIPSPYVSNNHQYKNAMDLVNRGAGLLLEEDKLNSLNLISLIDNVMNDQKKYKDIKTKVKEIGIKDSGERIYNILKELIKNDKRFY